MEFKKSKVLEDLMQEMQERINLESGMAPLGNRLAAKVSELEAIINQSLSYDPYTFMKLDRISFALAGYQKELAVFVELDLEFVEGSTGCPSYFGLRAQALSDLEAFLKSEARRIDLELNVFIETRVKLIPQGE